MPPRKRRQYGTGSITQRPDGKWVGRLEAGYTATGTRRRIAVVYTPKPGESKTKAEAETKRRLDRKRIELENDGPGAITTSRPTVKAWSETWLPLYERDVRPKTYATDASVVRRWIIPTIGHRKLTDLAPQDVRKVTDAVRKAGRTTTTARYAQAVLQRMLKAAVVLEGHKVSDRVLMLPKPSAAVSDRDAMSIEDAVKMLAAAETVPGGVRWWCALIQGMRQGEALGLTWDRVDLKAASVDISWQLQALPYAHGCRGGDTNPTCGDKRATACPTRRYRVPDGFEARQLDKAYHLTRPKTEQGQRIIPLLPTMVDHLTTWQGKVPESPHGLVFPRLEDSPRIKAGGPLNPNDDRTAWQLVQDKAGIAHPAGRPYLVHEIRHTSATFLLAAGVDEGTITSILGHSSIVTSRGYQHVDLAQKRAALTKAFAEVFTAPPQIEG